MIIKKIKDDYRDDIYELEETKTTKRRVYLKDLLEKKKELETELAALTGQITGVENYESKRDLPKD